MECLLEFIAGPLRSHPTAQAYAAGTPRCRGPKIAVEGSLWVALNQLIRSASACLLGFVSSAFQKYLATTGDTKDVRFKLFKTEFSSASPVSSVVER